VTIRSIDLQVMIPRSTEVSKTQQIVDHKNSLQQQENAQAWHQISENVQQAVQSAGKNIGGRVNAKNGGKSSAKREQYQSEKDDDSSDSDEQEKVPVAIDPLRGKLVDIKT